MEWSWVNHAGDWESNAKVRLSVVTTEDGTIAVGARLVTGIMNTEVRLFGSQKVQA